MTGKLELCEVRLKIIHQLKTLARNSRYEKYNLGRFVGERIVCDLAHEPYHATDVHGRNLRGGVHAACAYDISPRF